MIVSNSPPAKPAQNPETQKPIQRRLSTDSRFAVLLRPNSVPGSDFVGEDAPAYNRSGDQSHATSFEAMPMVGAVSVDMGTPGSVQPVAASDTHRLDTDQLDTSASPYGSVRPASVAPTAANFDSSLRGPAMPVIVPDGSPDNIGAPPVAVIGARSSGRATPAASTNEQAEVPRATIRRSPPSAVSEAIASALGAGVSVHFSTEGSQTRVAVRGLRMEAADRDEITGRIAKLMRAHGYAVSEDMIYFEGVGQ